MSDDDPAALATHCEHIHLPGDRGPSLYYVGDGDPWSVYRLDHAAFPNDSMSTRDRALVLALLRLAVDTLEAIDTGGTT